MRRGEKVLLGVAMSVALAFEWSAADTVVNLNFDRSGDVLPARSLDPGNAGVLTEYSYNWNDADVLFDGNAALGQKIYGGFHATSKGEASLKNFRLRNDGSGQFLQLSFSDSGAPGYERARMLFLWDAADFLAAANAFDGSANSVFSIHVPQNIQESDKPKGYRFVIRDGSTYYVSNQIFGNANGSFTASMAGDFPGLKWGEFDPNDLSYVNVVDESLGLGVTFSEQTFDNVTGVGFLADLSRWEGPHMQVQDFKVDLVPKPITLGMIRGVGDALLCVYRHWMG